MNPIYLDEIYLDKGGEENVSYNWVYYRLTSVDGLGNPSGEQGSTIQICRVTWPSLGDEGTPIDTPGHAGLTAAFPAMNKALPKWIVEHENRGILIGLRERAVNVDQPKANIGLSDEIQKGTPLE